MKPPFGPATIRELIPHRYPFLLVDRIETLEPGVRAVGIKNVTQNEPFFEGHFPDYPVMPGVLVVEALAQVGAVAVLRMPEHRGKLAFFAGIDDCRVKRVVEPGDVLELRCELERIRGAIGRGKAEARVDGDLACKATLTFAVER